MAKTKFQEMRFFGPPDRLAKMTSDGPASPKTDLDRDFGHDFGRKTPILSTNLRGNQRNLAMGTQREVDQQV